MAILYMDIIEYRMTVFFLITQRILQSQTIQESMVPKYEKTGSTVQNLSTQDSMVPVDNKKDWPLYLRSFRVTLVLGSTSTWVASSKRGGSLLCGWKFTWSHLPIS